MQLLPALNHAAGTVEGSSFAANKLVTFTSNAATAPSAGGMEAPSYLGKLPWAGSM